MLRIMILSMIAIAALLMGCTSAETLPTQASLPTVDPASLVTVEVTSTQVSTRTPVPRATLPPTFTPSPTLTETPFVTETPLPPTPTFEVLEGALDTGERPECSEFEVDFANSTLTFSVGQAPTAIWKAPAGAVSYHVVLVDERNRVIRDDIFVSETSFMFDADLFEANTIYVWSVYPRDENEVQMCLTRGSEMTVQSGS